MGYYLHNRCLDILAWAGNAICRLYMALPPSLSKEARAQWHKLVEAFREPVPMTAISQVCQMWPPSSISLPVSAAHAKP